MLYLFAYGNKVNQIIEEISRKFGCSEEAAYKDFKHMNRWAKKYVNADQRQAIFSTRMDVLHRETIDMIVDDKVKDSVKISAINSATKITVEQAKLLIEFGLVGGKSIEVTEKFSVKTPFEADPVLRQALMESIEKQRAEKQAKMEALEKKKLENAEGKKDLSKSSDAPGA